MYFCGRETCWETSCYPDNALLCDYFWLQIFSWMCTNLNDYDCIWVLLSPEVLLWYIAFAVELGVECAAVNRSCLCSLQKKILCVFNLYVCLSGVVHVHTPMMLQWCVLADCVCLCPSYSTCMRCSSLWAQVSLSDSCCLLVPVTGSRYLCLTRHREKKKKKDCGDVAVQPFEHKSLYSFISFVN